MNITPENPVLFGTDAFRVTKETFEATIATIECIGGHDSERLIADIRAQWRRQRPFRTATLSPQPELRTIVRALAREIQPQTYLEIGVRFGWCAAQVAAEVPNCALYLCDDWRYYAGAANPGPDFVRERLDQCAGTACDIRFLSGNSHDLLSWIPAGALLPKAIDLIVIDGDHSPLGLWWDLINALRQFGTAIVLDDIRYARREQHTPVTQFPAAYPPLPAGLDSVAHVWDWLQAAYPEHLFSEWHWDSYDVGVMRRGPEGSPSRAQPCAERSECNVVPTARTKGAV
jgi:predicted O-methyltransferase YrrM